MIDSNSLINEAKFAKKLTISLVKSPFYSNPDQRPLTDQLDKQLNEYFKKTRKFKINDHFAIKTLSVEFYQCDYHFKIVKVEPETSDEPFLVNNINSTLIQTENPVADKWIWFNYETSLLNEYTTELKRIIMYYREYHQNSDSLPIALVHGPSGCGKSRIVEDLCGELSFHLLKVNGINLSGDSASAVEKRIELFFQQSLSYGPCILMIRSFQFMFKLKDINEINKRIVSYLFQLIARLKSSADQEQHFFFVIFTTNSKQNIDLNVASHFNFEIQVKSLNEQQRRTMLLTKSIREANEMDELVKKTSGFYYGEMKSLIDLIDLSNVQQSFIKFLNNKKFQRENKLNIESISWNDVGGLANIKEIISDTILLPLNYPYLFKSTEKQLGITRSGILLYGPPGTGKTLLAKAISNECEINFLSVKGPELLDMYVGQTEQNVRSLFEKARLNSPCILFFDELDSLAPVRGRAGDSGGVMDRVVSQLLTEIDGMDKHSSSSKNSEKSTQIFLIGATNRPDLIDASLLRPGRFDKLIYVPIAQSLSERVNIFNALLRKLPVDSQFNSESFVKEKCPLNLTGADFYAITNKARQHALKRIIRNELIENFDESLIVLNETDFENAVESFQPSLSEKTLLEYEKYFNNYSNRNK